MKTSLLVLVAVLALLFGVLASAQDMPLRGVGLLALNASEAPATPPPTRAIESPDDGGGASLRNGRGSGDLSSAATEPGTVRHAAPVVVPDALPAAAGLHGDPNGALVAPTPKRPTYRWQSLVPGAIK